MIASVAIWFNDGGPFMWVILGVLAIASAVVLERLFFFYIACANDTGRLVADIAHALNGDNLNEAKIIASRKKAPVNMLLGAALDAYGAQMEIADIQDNIEEMAITQIPRLSERINYLSLFANVATLLGLLGTITGLQLSFTSLAAVEASRKATMLATGISQAMLTTAFGLIVAVPCMVIYTFLVNKQQKLTKDLDEAVVKVMNYLKKKKS